ncbi:unnamed protein product [Clavelina lepadiformis]|uniref:Uncharacterized protein n=1 Tax=Clavelina lepadiformis TaxID=159417 RepID=A0ABP0GHK9_CLALP
MEHLYMPNPNDGKVKQEINRLWSRTLVQGICLGVLYISILVFALIYFLNVPVSPYQSGQSVNPAMQRMYDKSNGDIDDLEERLANYQAAIVEMNKTIETLKLKKDEQDRQHKDELNSLSERMKKRFDAFESVLDDRMTSTKNELSKSVNDTKKELEREVLGINKELQTLRSFISFTESQLASSLKNVNDKAEAEKIDMMTYTNDSLSLLKLQMNEINSRLDHHDIRANDTDAQLAPLLGNLDDTRQEISNTNRNLKRLSDNALPRIQNVQNLIGRQANRLGSEIQALKNEANNNSTRISEILNLTAMALKNNLSTTEDIIRREIQNNFATKDALDDFERHLHQRVSGMEESITSGRDMLQLQVSQNEELILNATNEIQNIMVGMKELGGKVVRLDNQLTTINTTLLELQDNTLDKRTGIYIAGNITELHAQRINTNSDYELLRLRTVLNQASLQTLAYQLDTLEQRNLPEQIKAISEKFYNLQEEVANQTSIVSELINSTLDNIKNNSVPREDVTKLGSRISDLHQHLATNVSEDYEVLRLRSFSHEARLATLNYIITSLKVDENLLESNFNDLRESVLADKTSLEMEMLKSNISDLKFSLNFFKEDYVEKSELDFIRSSWMEKHNKLRENVTNLVLDQINELTSTLESLREDTSSNETEKIKQAATESATSINQRLSRLEYEEKEIEKISHSDYDDESFQTEPIPPEPVPPAYV